MRRSEIVRLNEEHTNQIYNHNVIQGYDSVPEPLEYVPEMHSLHIDADIAPINTNPCRLERRDS